MNIILMEPIVKTTIKFNDDIQFKVKKRHWIDTDYIIDPYTLYES
jgi:hypothetical protein